MIVCICSLSTFTANAADSFDSLEVSVTSEKESYKKDEKLTFEVKVINNNDFALDEVSLNAVLPNEFAFTENKDYKMHLNANETKTYQISAKAVEETAAKSDKTDSPKTGDGGILIFAVIFGAAVIIAFKTKKGRKVLSVVIAVSLCSSLIPNSYKMNVSAADDVRTVTASADFKYADKAYTLDLTAEYKKDDMVTIDTSSFDGPNSAGYFNTDQIVDTLNGSLKNPSEIKKLSYTVKDVKENVVLSGDIDIAADWSVKDFGLVIGYNSVVVTAVDKNGIEHNAGVSIFNNSPENMNRTNVDTKDDDGDGFCNYYEIILDTDPQKQDTDGDGLTDYEEHAFSATDPTKKCTNPDGISDADADEDKDGLSNSKEIELGTRCLLKDSDGDGLTDGDEVNKYGTDPLKPDTDDDGITDDKELELGTDPLKTDTNGNGINDNDERTVQTKTLAVDTLSNPGVSEISVTLNCPGHIDDKLSVMNTYDLDMRSSDVVGLVGVPVEIHCSEEFDTADITFKYDESELGDTNEEDLRMLWYDEENDNYVPLDAVLDTENNTITYKTTHFSTYLVVDKKVWIDAMRANIDYRNSTDTSDLTYYDLALVVDVSGSMSGDRIAKAKQSLGAFISSMLNSDRAGIVKFNSYATKVIDLTKDQAALQSSVNALSASGGTQAMRGLSAGLDMLIANGSANAPIAILVCDGDVYYDSAVVNKAITNNITVFCINVVNGSSTVLERIANETGGEYYYAANNDDIETAVAKLKGDTISSVDVTDTDGDGLYDVYEVKGMKMSNGKVQTSDPNKSDSVLPGTPDGKSMGGTPTTETITIDGETFTSVLWHNPVYNTLSSKFMYVDGRRNSNGIVNNDKLNFIPCSDSFYNDKYVTEKVAEFKSEPTRTVNGEAGRYESFLDIVDSGWEAAGYWAKYEAIGSLVAILVDAIDLEAGFLIHQFVLGCGGPFQGYAPAETPGSTRDIIDGRHTVQWGIGVNQTPFNHLDLGLINSANDYYKENMGEIYTAAQSVLNEYNTDVYISLAPTYSWTGCMYNDIDVRWSWDYAYQCIDTLCNIPAFGIYNKADAGGVLHCSYDPVTKLYAYEYTYMLIDYYDFPLLEAFNEMNVIGVAQTFELIGYLYGIGVGGKNAAIILS